MQNLSRAKSGKAQSILVFVALVGAISFFSLYTHSETHAQTESSAVSDPPTLKAEATARGVLLSWEAVPDAERYELMAWWDEGTGWRRIGGDNLTGTSYTHTSVSAGTKYHYTIRTVNAAGEKSAWLLGDYPSATFLEAAGVGTSTPTPTATAAPEAGTFTPTPIATVTAPSALKLTAEATARGVVLRWETAPDAARYALMTWWDAGTGWQPIGGNNLTGTSYTHTDVTAGTKYHYTIRAVNAAGEKGAWLLEDYPSAITLATQGAGTSTPTPTPTATATPGAGTSTPTSTPTPTATASAPSALKLTAEATARGVVLRWETAPDAARYELMTWWDAGTGWQPIGGDKLTGTSYTHTTVTTGTKYHYTIRVVYAAGETSAWLLGDYPSATALATPGAATSTPTPTPATTERDALIALYNATNGPTWVVSHNWLTTAPLSTWSNVTTDANGRVTELRLSTNALRGSIPDLGALTNLTALFLEHNRLSGPIPDLSALSNLITLNLSDNLLSGQIPDLSALSNLRWLALSDNRLSGQIPNLSALSNLRLLYLSHNQLNGPIPDLSELTFLIRLVLNHNQLSGPFPRS